MILIMLPVALAPSLSYDNHRGPQKGGSTREDAGRRACASPLKAGAEASNSRRPLRTKGDRRATSCSHARFLPNAIAKECGDALVVPVEERID